MTNSKDVRVIVVVGMHRSGTSLVTRGLDALGVPLGDNVLSQSAPDNEKGHWEDIDVRKFNERMMASAGRAVGCHRWRGRGRHGRREPDAARRGRKGARPIEIVQPPPVGIQGPENRTTVAVLAARAGGRPAVGGWILSGR